MANFGFCSGLPAGLILERFGPKWGSLSALFIIAIGYFGFYLALIYPKEFGTSLFWLFVTSAFVSGKCVSGLLFVKIPFIVLKMNVGYVQKLPSVVTLSTYPVIKYLLCH